MRLSLRPLVAARHSSNSQTRFQETDTPEIDRINKSALIRVPVGLIPREGGGGLSPKLVISNISFMN